MKLNNKKLFQLHGWLGITLGLPLFVICLSGTFAVISPELDWLAHKEMRVSPPVNGEPLSWGVLTQKVKEAYPSGTISTFYSSDSPGKAWQAGVSFSSDDFRLVHIDPYTGNVQGQTSIFNLKSFFRIFHKQFYILEGPFWPHGRIFVCVFALVLLGSAITGILFYKKWWRSLFRLRFKPRRKFWSDLHRLIGVWALLFSILFGLTGSWYLALKLLEDFDVFEHDPRVVITEKELADKPLILPDISIDEAVEEVKKVYPELKIQGIFFNSRPGASLSFHGDGPAILVSSFSNRVSMDPYDKSVLHVEKAHELGFGSRLIEAADPLHFGRFGGWITKIIWTLAGFAISLSILAGAIIWWLRVTRKGEGGRHRNRAASYIPLVCNIGLMLFAVYASYSFISRQLAGPESTKPGYKAGQQKAGPWEFTAYVHKETHDSQASYYSFSFQENIPNIKSLAAWPGNSEPPDKIKPLRGSLTRFEMPAKGVADRLNVRIEDHSGKQFDLSFSLDQLPEQADKQASPPPPPAIPFGVKFMVGLFIFITAIPLIFWLVYIR